MPSRIANAFTVDVEDYFHVTAFADCISARQWDDQESRVVASTQRILDLLDERQVQGTFFVLGWVAERYPELVRRIDLAGHEIGCHSYWHRLVYELTPEEFRDDLRRATMVLEDIIGRKVELYRAPSFSITARSLWAFDVLADEGYQIDSSVFPVRHDVYGIPDAPRHIYRAETARGGLWEFPPPVRRFGRWNLPLGGGGYFRLYPSSLTHRWLTRINDVDRQPFLFYIHPWEFDPEQPRLPGRWRSRFRHYQNLHTTESKTRRLLDRFAFTSMGRVVAEQLGPSSAPSTNAEYAG